QKAAAAHRHGRTGHPIGRRRIGFTMLNKKIDLKRFDVIGGVLCLVLMAAFALSAAGLAFGSLRSPDAGLWPLSISLCGVLLSVLIILFGHDSPHPDGMTSPGQIILYLAALVLFPPAYFFFGF